MIKDYFNKLYTGAQSDFFQIALDALIQQEKMFVVTANPETMMIGEQNELFNQVLCKSYTTIVPDGIGVVKAAEALGIQCNGRVTGVELSSFLIEQAGRVGKSIYLYGAKEEVVSALVQKIQQSATPATVVGYRNGYNQNDDEVFEEICKLKPDVVLVALGIPRQEILIDKWYNKFDKGIFIGVGGSFDVLSGCKKRAPHFFVRFNLEWLYRIVKEPKRFSRFYHSNIKFLSEIRRLKKQMG